MLVRFLQSRADAAPDEKPSFLRPTLHCRSCNRDDIHLFGMRRSKAVYIYSVIYTFGLIFWFGPYHCICCGHRRWTRFEMLKWFRKSAATQAVERTASGNQ